MSKDRTIAIPVHRDTRTFEQYRKDFLKDVENFPNYNNSILPYHDNWFNEVDDWIKSSWKRWDDEMKRIRNGMFQLMPLDNFGLSNWDAFDTSFDPNNLIRQMEQRIQNIRREMGITDAPFTGSLNDFLKDAYEVGKDGKDGVLILEAPVKPNNHKSVTFNNERQIAIRPTHTGNVTPSKDLVVKGTNGLTIIDEGFKGKRLHIEIPIDPMYKSEDLCVHVDSNRVVVSGRCSKSDSRWTKNTPCAEFSHSYDIPHRVDPLSVTSQMVGNTLVVEAPLLKSY
ncbi:unnamed protein product [Schistosoma margrebowiei]|uniref:SHSP domain-containing protein n=1 Tax=Schistosoma margrebowiei TaxID=48269 RepID=A0AA84ZP90_9TREM|nr:unnamed protein product [Schistosoma margrebowiei]